MTFTGPSDRTGNGSPCALSRFSPGAGALFICYCGLFGVGLDGTSVFGLIENGVHGVHLPVDFRFQSDLPFFLILSAIQDIHESHEALIAFP